MQVFLQIAALFILMAIGFVFGKMKLIDSNAIRGISNLIIKASLPALILTSLQQPFSSELLDDSVQTLIVAAIFYVTILLISVFAVKMMRAPAAKRGTLAFSLGFSNAGFIGFPVITSILGTRALFLTSIHNIVFNLLAFSAGLLIMGMETQNTGDTNGKQRLRIPFHKIMNINVIASIVGFVLFICSITLPRVLSLPLEILGDTTTPLAMVTTGAMLARTPIRSIIGDRLLYVVTILRLIVWPFLTAAALKRCHISGDLYYITVIIAGMPAASNTSLIAELYGGDTDTASAIVCMTTLFSVISIPALALILV